MAKKKFRNKIKLSSEICLKSGWAQGYKATTFRYSNCEGNWQEINEQKSQQEIDADLLRYSREGNKRKVRLALENYGADINVKDIDNNDALILAVDSGCKELISYLCEYGKENGLNFNHLNNDRKSALHKAVKKNYFKSVTEIQKAGGDINLKGAYSQTPIFEVVIKQEITEEDVEMIQLICDLGGEINTKNRELKTPFMECCHSKRRIEGLKKLTELAYNEGILEEVSNSKDANGNTPMLHAINSTNAPVCDYLKKLSDKRYLDLNLANKKGVTPLMLAAKRGYKQALRVLLATNKINIFAKDKKERTALDYAKMFNNNTCMEILTKAEKYATKDMEIKGLIKIAERNYDNESLSKLREEEKIYSDLSFFGKQNKVQNSFAK